jgi:NAD(P)-dependent dehydrogenase (short-subunit alcohol dehydrogenase family)
MPRQTNQVAIITGGGRGIGAATARLAAKHGYLVCVNYRSNGAAAQQEVADIEERNGKAIAVAADVSDERDVRRLFETCDRSLGVVTALVNNARNPRDTDACRRDDGGQATSRTRSAAQKKACRRGKDKVRLRP